jgi:hypothetical protein
MATERGGRVQHSCQCSTCKRYPHGQVAKEHRRINRLVAAADERNRRLLAGFLARQQGRGGITLLARVTGLSRTTILRGMRELQRPGTPAKRRVRRQGGGRKRFEKKLRRS